MYIIYKATSPSGKSYIGLTKEGLKKRKYRHELYAARGSENPFHRAIRKYTKSNIKWTILRKSINDRSKANELEKYYISKYNTLADGYNCTIGGDGYDPGTRPKCLDCSIEVRNWGAKRCLKCFSKYRKSKIYRSIISESQKNSYKSNPSRREKCSKSVGPGKIIQVFDIQGKLIYQNLILEDISSYLNLSGGMIWRCLKGIRSSLYKGYIFKYKD